MRTLLCFILISTIASAFARAAEETPSPRLQVSDTVTLSGMLDAQAIAEIKTKQALVIDLGTDFSATEQQTMREQGIDYVHLPTGGTTPDVAHVQRFDELLTAAADRQVWVHCSSANRASLMWATRQIYRGASHSQAYNRVRRLVTKPQIEQAIFKFDPNAAVTSTSKKSQSNGSKPADGTR